MNIRGRVCVYGSVCVQGVECTSMATEKMPGAPVSGMLMRMGRGSFVENDLSERYTLYI